MHKPWDRGGLRSYLIALGLLANQATTGSVLYAAPFLAAGIVMHLWAKGCLHQNQEVTVSGPYRFVRHPFYLGNLFIDSSVVIMSGWLPLICLLPLLWIGVYLPTMRREEAGMAKHFGKAYRDYMARVPGIIPRGHALPSTPGFSWRNRNILRTELPRSLRFLSYPFIFLLCSEIGTKQFIASPHVSPLCFYSLLMILLLNGLASHIRWAATGDDLWQHPWLSRPSARIALLMIFVIVGVSCTYLEFESDSITMPVGLILMGLSLWARQRMPQAPGLAETALLFGACLLWEVPWLGAVPILFCFGPWLATQGSRQLAGVQTARSGALPLIPCGRTGSTVFLVICLLGFLTREVIADLL